MDVKQQVTSAKACVNLLGGALPLLNNVLAPSHFGLESAINGEMTGWIVDFKVSSVVQPTNQSMLP